MGRGVGEGVGVRTGVVYTGEGVGVGVIEGSQKHPPFEPVGWQVAFLFNWQGLPIGVPPQPSIEYAEQSSIAFACGGERNTKTLRMVRNESSDLTNQL